MMTQDTFDLFGELSSDEEEFPPDVIFNKDFTLEWSEGGSDIDLHEFRGTFHHILTNLSQLGKMKINLVYSKIISSIQPNFEYLYTYFTI